MTGTAFDTRRGAAALVAVTAVVLLLSASGALPRWPGLLHHVALPPLDLVGDIGALLVGAPSIPAFLAGLALSVVVRSAVVAALMGRLDRDGFLYVLRFYLVVLPFALVAAFLLYAAGAVLYYAFFWCGLIATLALFVLTAAAPWQHPTALRQGFAIAARAGLRAGTLGAYLLGLSMLGYVADLGGEVASMALVPASAILTLLTVRFLLDDPGHAAARRALAAVPATGGVSLVLVALLGPTSPPVVDGPTERRDGSVMLMSGIDSSSGSGAMLEIDPRSLGWTCEETYYFSYAGTGDGQPRNKARCPITQGAPYGPEDTLRSREALVPFLEAQVADMAPPAVVLGHSQGGWLLWEAAASRRLPGVETIILVGAFPENPVAYPGTDEHAPGRVGRLLLGVVETLGRLPIGDEETTVFEAGSPLGQEWLGHPHAIERTFAMPLPDGMRALAVPSLFDLPLMPGRDAIDEARSACPIPVLHPNLPYAREFADTVSTFLDGDPLPDCPPWRKAVGALVRHFSVPPSRR